MTTVTETNGTLVFILALAVGVLGGALAHRYALRKHLGEVARGAAMVAGFIVGFLLTYVVVSAL